ncbi:MAG: winged helix DNA-binding protein [Pseudomonadota bacterium]|nr:winged helix DNA-binding protein [Pseudomonadota bacterium]
MPEREPENRRPESDGKTVILSGRDVEHAARLLQLLAGDRSSPDVDGSAAHAAQAARSGHWLLARAQQVLRHRQLRTEYFPRSIFSEAAWEILLVLYVTDSAGPRQTLASLAKLTATPPTTVQRWVDYLVRERLVQRDSHPTDRRVTFVSLLGKGRKALDDYLSALAA